MPMRFPKALQPLEKAVCQLPFPAIAVGVVSFVGLVLLMTSSYELDKMRRGDKAASGNEKLIVGCQFVAGLAWAVLGMGCMYSLIANAL